MTTYFDSSVLVKAYCLETGSPQAVTLIRQVGPPILFTPLHTIEIKNALRLKRHRTELTQFQMQGALENLQHDIDSGFLHMPDLDLRAVFDQAEFLSAAYTAAIGTRSLDILHVAAASVLGAGKFVSLDRRQRSLALKAGMKILPKIMHKI